jgi:NADP-dependent 3-hydroxy acid dehydrogenase YdfG
MAKREPEVVVVTGASAGVGRAAARAFARDGADLGLLARGKDGLEAARREVEELGGRAVAIATDVADAGAVEAAAERIEEELGPIDVWVNNAMVTVMSEIKDTPPEEFRRVTEVTYLGVVHGTLSALHRMLPRNRGHVVQVGSALAYRAIPLQAAYCAAKFAVRGFTDSLRAELMHHGSDVAVTMVQMPGLNTPQFSWSKMRFDKHPQPVPPIYQPEVAADALVFASHHPHRREIWVGWPTVQGIAGNKIAPGLGDRYLAAKGFDSQQYDGHEDPNRPHNLWEPVPGDHGAHGAFDERAQDHSAQLWITTHRTLLAAAGAGVAGLAGLAWTALAGRRGEE